jgi:hypothetical protein
MMTRSVVLALAGTASLLFRTGEVAPTAQPVSRVSFVASPTLRDVAVAVYDSQRPVIFYNPDLMGNFTPELRTFFFAHEYGHLAFHHTRASALGLRPAGRDSLLQSRELEADCFAARELAPIDRAAVNAAARFFSRMGSRQMDHEHPTGAQRAARILACLP